MKKIKQELKKLRCARAILEGSGAPELFELLQVNLFSTRVLLFDAAQSGLELSAPLSFDSVDE